MLYDISPPVSADLGVWPGDSPVSREVLCDLRNGDTITLSTLRMTVHGGAHADAPNHYVANGPSIESRNLDYYLGPCQVLHTPTPRGQRIPASAIDGTDIHAPRVLLATGSFPDATNWNTDFAALEPDLVDRLHGLGVRLVGIDTPSVDLFDSKDLPSHGRFLAHDMAILEGLVLADVPEGDYELIALPLKLVGFDASPVRAVLRSR